MRSPAWLDRLYSLGLPRHDQLNRAFGGGLPKGSIVVVEGRYGTGKSTLGARFAYGLCEQSYDVSYLSTERPVGSFLDQTRSLSYDVTGALLDQDLLYLFGDLSGFDDDPPPLLTRLTSSRRLWETDVAIIDSLSDVLRYDPTFETLAEATSHGRAARKVLSFFRRLARTDRTVVLTVDPTGLAEETLEPFRSMADVLLELTVSPGNRNVRRTIDVKRFVGMGQRVEDSIGFSIRPGVGIVVENRHVVRTGR
jgi:flagellar protein FlaH